MDAALRDLVWQRADAICEYCHLSQEHQPFAPFHIEHIRPKKHHGADAASNLALACGHCNRHKSSNLVGIDPETGEMVPLFHPRKHNWEEHFEWDGPELRARTPIGRVTIEVLAINASRRIELREQLITEGVFPPSQSQ